MAMFIKFGENNITYEYPQYICRLFQKWSILEKQFLLIFTDIEQSPDQSIISQIQVHLINFRGNEGSSEKIRSFLSRRIVPGTGF